MIDMRDSFDQQKCFMQLLFSTPCVTCKGRGKKIKRHCGACRGTARKWIEELLTLPIPAGVEDGMRLNVAGKGEAPLQGGRPGDLLVEITLLEDSSFERRGRDLHHHTLITFVEATLGGKVKVPTLEGSVQLEVPAGTQSGSKVRLKGKGLPTLHQKTKGDQFVHFQVWTPQNLNKAEVAQIEVLRSLSKLRPEAKKETSFFEKFKQLF